MNKLETNISILAITFFSAMQYVFLANIPPSVSTFCFICITNVVGFLATIIFFARELYRIDRKQIRQSIVLAVELVAYNIFLILGSDGMDATAASCVITIFFIFIPPIMLVMKQRVARETLFASILVLVGIFLVMDADFNKFFNIKIIYLVLADIMFAIYIVSVGAFALRSNPAILAMGQMLFAAMLSFVIWMIEAVVIGTPISLPMDFSFWASIFFISIFIRALYGVVQVNAQRYISPINVSILFSTEIVMTLFISPFVAYFMEITSMHITGFKIAGCCIIIMGVLVSDGTVIDLLKNRALKMRA